MAIQERLVLKNFFSIKSFDWDIKDFNILTGGMAAGKSLCIKVVHFIENIFIDTIFFADLSKDTLTKERFYAVVSENFRTVFHSSKPEQDFHNTEISYTYTVTDGDKQSVEFDLQTKWNESAKRLEWSSRYIDKNLDKWRNFLGETLSPDAAKNARRQIYENISHDFLNSFPVATLFIPASRAIAAVTNKAFGISDTFLESFINDTTKFVLNFDRLSDKPVNTILRIKNIKLDMTKTDKEISIELHDGRVISSLELSSGQQELVYLLLLIKNLPQTNFLYGESVSIFIEEPSAHLFPQEQKDSIEYIVSKFSELKKKDIRFFITTHSPYILNVINNMLKKGYAISLAEQCADPNLKKTLEEELSAVPFPHLTADELSAHFIEESGEVTNMFSGGKSDPYLYEEKIESITQSINKDYRTIRDIIKACEES
jgi:predicted ATPase